MLNEHVVHEICGTFVNLWTSGSGARLANWRKRWDNIRWYIFKMCFVHIYTPILASFSICKRSSWIFLSGANICFEVEQDRKFHSECRSRQVLLSEEKNISWWDRDHFDIVTIHYIRTAMCDAAIFHISCNIFCHTCYIFWCYQSGRQ